MSTIRLGIVGAYYPWEASAGNSTTGLAVLFNQAKRVRLVRVYCQVGGKNPAVRNGRAIELVTVWQFNRVWSILRLIQSVLKERNQTDAVVFNLLLTTFGRSRLSNGLGLTLPILVSRVLNKPTLVYLHQLVETQDVGELGYVNRRFSTLAARILERWLANTTALVVPLESQRKFLNLRGCRTVHSVLVPYVEAVPLLTPSSVEQSSPKAGTRIRVLLFGFWGPQKDLAGALATLQKLIRRGLNLDVVVAGEVNRNFPDYSNLVSDVRNSIEASSEGAAFTFIGKVPSHEIPKLMMERDVLFLPYKATGGYSGALNMAAAFDLPVVSYDLPEIRETANAIGIEVALVPPNDESRIEEELSRIGRERELHSSTLLSNHVAHIERSRLAAEELLNILLSPELRT